MPNLTKYRRALTVGGLSVVLFGWCLALAAPDDNARLFRTLHAAHRSPKYQQAVKTLNQQAGARLNECSACHPDTGPVSMLVAVRPPVPNEACSRCHTNDPEKAVAKAYGSRAMRPGHERGQPTEDKGLWVSPAEHPGAPLACASCHPDHIGDVKKSEDDPPKLVLNRVCLPCHIPEENSDAARRVIAKFKESHSYEGDTPQALWKNVLETDPCTSCHGEHTPQEGMDAMPEASSRAPHGARLAAAVRRLLSGAGGARAAEAGVKDRLVLR